MSPRWSVRWLAAAVILVSGWNMGASPAEAQELEPRLLSNAPVGMNFTVLGYGYSRGNILLDPALPIEGLNGSLHAAVAAYLRTFSLFGRTAKIDIVVPVVSGDWTGQVEGVDSARAISGLGDPRVRVSWTFAGAPALTAQEFASYDAGTVAGASVQVIAPLGQYDPSKLINLGGNRWTLRGLVGISQAHEKWIIEGYGGLWLFGTNSDFWGGQTLKQKPIVTAKTHLIRTFQRGRWLALDLGYGIGGRAEVNGVERNNRLSTFRFGVTFAFPIARSHTLKFLIATAVATEKGPDFDTFGANWQHRW